MHTLLVMTGGMVLLGLFALFGKLWGTDTSGIAIAVQAFIPAWLILSLVNLSVGVMRAGYTITQELPILAVVFVVPATIAAIAAWYLMKG